MSAFLFWAAAGLLAYLYALFPALLALRGWLRPRPVADADVTPSMSLIIAAHNEAEVIEAKLENALQLDYPADCFEVIVASDGSDDATNPIVARHAGSRVRLLVLPRQGKAKALNAAVAAARGEVLVFSDANSMYAPDALRQLARPFADPTVGGVAGNQQYQKARGAGGRGERQYWRLDTLLKQLESAAGNTISATGAIYAVRHDLVDPLPDGVTDDFFLSTGVIARGYRLVFAPQAVAYENLRASSGDQFGRKVRIISRGLQAVRARRELLNPARFGFYSLQLWSHKVLRRLAFLPLTLLALLAPRLWRRGPLYRLAAGAQAAFYGLAAAGWALERRTGRAPKPLALPLYFCTVNLAALVAVANLLRGRRIVTWEPTDRALNPEEQVR